MKYPRRLQPSAAVWLVAISLVAACTKSPASPAADTGLADTGPLVPADAGMQLSTDGGRDSSLLTDAAADSGMIPDQGDYDGPLHLSQTGLYGDIAAGTLAQGVESYEPQGVLWADGADKQRWISLPTGQKIDTSDMDHWKYPVGTKLWKEFSLGGKRLETRLIEKRTDGTWRMAAYIWNAQNSDAVATPFGAVDVGGTDHDVPSGTDCKKCHEGLADRVLGFTAVQLSGQAKGLTLAKLISDGSLSAPPAAPFALPGDATEQAALRYLHANCGHCHNPDSPGADRNISVYFLQRTDSLATVQDTVTYKSLVTNKMLPLWIDAVKRRTANRGVLGVQMPPLATDKVDTTGLMPVYAWMDKLAKTYPAPQPIIGGGPCTTGLPEVYQLFVDRGCQTGFCHMSDTGQGMLKFTTQQEFHDTLVNVPAKGDACKDYALKRVEPGDPERSLLLIKLRGGPYCGKAMPQLLSLTDMEIKQVSDWITACDPP